MRTMKSKMKSLKLDPRDYKGVKQEWREKIKRWTSGSRWMQTCLMQKLVMRMTKRRRMARKRRQKQQLRRRPSMSLRQRFC